MNKYILNLGEHIRIPLQKLVGVGERGDFVYRISHLFSPTPKMFWSGGHRTMKNPAIL
jgi:hypothetical protein